MRAIVAPAAFLLATPAAAQVAYPPVDASQMATKAEVSAVQAQIPTPATAAPPSVADAGTPGNTTTVYALANHTHASKARKGRVLVPVAGFTDVVFSTAFTTGVVPLCAVTAETSSGDTNVVNSQIDGVTTATGLRIRITRTAVTVSALLGLSILSVPTQVATYAQYICIEP